jgi:hypothetical protein
VIFEAAVPSFGTAIKAAFLVRIGINFTVELTFDK